MTDNSFELMRQNIFDRNQLNIEQLRLLSELIGDCEALGDRQSSIQPNRSPRLIYAKYGLKIEPSTVPESGYWIMQNWSHPKHGSVLFSDVMHTQFVKAVNAPSLRSILLKRASIVEEILAHEPIRWHHSRFGIEVLAAIVLTGMFSVIGIVVFLLSR
jgi:hypothetical protein